MRNVFNILATLKSERKTLLHRKHGGRYIRRDGSHSELFVASFHSFYQHHAFSISSPPPPIRIIWRQANELMDGSQPISFNDMSYPLLQCLSLLGGTRVNILLLFKLLFKKHSNAFLTSPKILLLCCWEAEYEQGSGYMNNFRMISYVGHKSAH